MAAEPPKFEIRRMFEIFIAETFVLVAIFVYVFPDVIEDGAYRLIIQTIMIVIGVLFPFTMNMAFNTRNRISKRLQYWVESFSGSLLRISFKKLESIGKKALELIKSKSIRKEFQEIIDKFKEFEKEMNEVAKEYVVEKLLLQGQLAFNSKKEVYLTEEGQIAARGILKLYREYF
ncbi:MAG: hypothetical protein J7L47_10295 [Candidatus Odinarchaeota archaeon]|nr:hypothetical protein [Candidatus Odinarchaeota archaeon]